MITLGVDLAASPKNTGVAVLDGLNVVELKVGADDDCLEFMCAGADKIGIDCPLGWPDAFIDFVVGQAANERLPAADTVTARRPLAYRTTDVLVAQDHPPLRPLSVATDRIAHAAFRCAVLLSRLDPTRDRTGDGRVVETYPAGSLHAWGLPFRGYKGTRGRPLREHIVGQLANVVTLGPFDRACRDTDHALDAVVAALTAYACARGAVSAIPSPHIETARREGWIRVPTCSLEELAAM